MRDDVADYIECASLHGMTLDPEKVERDLDAWYAIEDGWDWTDSWRRLFCFHEYRKHVEVGLLLAKVACVEASRAEKALTKAHDRASKALESLNRTNDLVEHLARSAVGGSR